ncbi:MAG: hypothetical protein Q4A07_10065 [Coriobacteriales bacterium]|nr:hypothetical protein [Coriobacteriales bacterium]
MQSNQPYSHPYHLIAQDALDGRKVAVFCDNQSQVDRTKNLVYDALLDLGANKTDVSQSKSAPRVTVRGNAVEFLLTNGVDGRGMSADVVYLSESARMQNEFALLS